MRLSSPTDHLVSVHRHTSYLRDCNPIEESKQEKGRLHGYCTTSMNLPDRDLKSRRPRTYSNSAFYPSRRELLSSSNMAAVVAPRSIGEEESDEEDVKQPSRGHKPADHGPSSSSFQPFSPSSSPILRQKKSSWPPSGMGRERQSFADDDYEDDRGREARGESVQMKPLVAASSGMAAGERLPGIAHLDEQMHTPWSVGNARKGEAVRAAGPTGGVRSNGLVGSSGEDSLRRLSSQTFSHGPRSWRSSLHESLAAGSRVEKTMAALPSHSSPRMLQPLGRPSSPSHNSYDNDHGRVASTYHINNDRLPYSRGASPVNTTGGPILPQPFEPEAAPSYRQRQREWPEERFSSAPAAARAPAPPQLPATNGLFDDRRSYPALPGAAPGYDGREELYRHSPPHRERAAYGGDRSEYSYGTSQPAKVRDAEGSSRLSYHYEPAMAREGERSSSYGSRLYDRDSPSYYAEESSSSRIGTSSPRHHPYSNVNTSPNVPRRRGKLPKVVTDLLKTWLLDHASHPYPTEDEKRRLCSVTGLSISQVSNWFINARRRILVPQGSGNFALGHPGQPGPQHQRSGSAGSPPSPIPAHQHHQQQQHHFHHPHHQQQPHHHQQHASHLASSHQPSLHHEDSIHHMYRRGNSHSPKHLSRRSMDEAQ